MKYPFLISILLISIINANAEDYFYRLNPSPTKDMKLNKKNARTCKNPAVAKENFDIDFHYGCFCGKKYPNIRHSSGKTYKHLNRKEREELIAKYYKIKPYDDIDKLCMKHDICFIYEGREDQLCNDAIYNGLRNLEKNFEQQSQNKKSKRCQRLAIDISSVFGTIFGIGDNISPIKFALFVVVTTPITIVSKGIQKSSRMLNSDSTYPLANEKCNTKPLAF